MYRIDNNTYKSQSTENFTVNKKVESVQFFSNSNELLRTILIKK